MFVCPSISFLSPIDAGLLLITFLLRFFFFLVVRRPLTSTLFPYTTLFRSSLIARRRLRRKVQGIAAALLPFEPDGRRSEEHTSELQSPCNLVCRLLLEK